MKKEKQDTEKPLRYSEMSLKQLEEEIKTERDFANKQGVSEWTLKDIARAEKEIKSHKEKITEKKRDYLESIKINKEYMKKAKYELKKAKKEKVFYENFKKNQLNFVKILKEIKDNLTKNPNYYKELNQK